MFEKVESLLKQAKIIPVVKIDNKENVLPLCDALSTGGINVIEITFRTQKGEEGFNSIAECIKTIKENRPDFLVGAGTVINASIAERAITAGASFIVSPGFNAETVDFCLKKNIPVFPGVSTPSEVELALSKGLTVLKYFPSEAGGGAPYIKALLGPFPTVKFIATGGINASNVAEYFKCKNVLACGGSWMATEELIKSGHWRDITKFTKQALLSIEKSESKVVLNSAEKKIKPALYLFPVTLGETSVKKVIPSYNLEVLKTIKYFIVENRRSAVRFIKQAVPEVNVDSLDFKELSEHTKLQEITSYLNPLLKNKMSIGVLSEAGCPAVADPGAMVVEMAHKKNLTVVPLVGPSSMIMAVMASGFNGQSFAFNGYLPVKENERIGKLKKLENRAWSENQTELFIEAPYRNLKMLESILNSLKKDTRLCIACGITTDEEYIQTHTIEEWKKLPAPDINKIPAIFLIYKS